DSKRTQITQWAFILTQLKVQGMDACSWRRLLINDAKPQTNARRGRTQYLARWKGALKSKTFVEQTLRPTAQFDEQVEHAGNAVPRQGGVGLDSGVTKDAISAICGGGDSWRPAVSPVGEMGPPPLTSFVRPRIPLGRSNCFL
ncbi:MAG TPA: hypothetical protein VIK52_08675, partial [Opitutaceae bacterium]